jgi:hypothetical protein
VTDKPRKQVAKKPIEGTVVNRNLDGTFKPILDDTARAKIMEALQAGSYTDAAVAYAGVSRSQFYTWLNLGNDVRDRLTINPDLTLTPHEQQCLELLDAVEQSKASAEVAAIGVIRRAAREGVWQAAAWWLERTQPSKWGRVMREPDSSPNDSGPQAIVSLEELEAAVREVREQRAKRSGD